VGEVGVGVFAVAGDRDFAEAPSLSFTFLSYKLVCCRYCILYTQIMMSRRCPVPATTFLALMEQGRVPQS